MALVTVIIPTYNREKDMLKRALVSVVKQEYKNLEILVIDDNKIQMYSEKVEEAIEEVNDQRVRLIKNIENIGGAASRNKGASLSKGDYISFLDDDDFYRSEKLSKQVSFIESGKYDFIISNLAIVDEAFKLKDLRNFKWFNENEDNERQILNHFKYHLTGTPTFLFKSEVFKKVGGFPEVNIGHEFHLVYQALKQDYKLGYLNATLAVAVIHQGERISNSAARQKDLNDLLNFKMNKVGYINDKDRNEILYRHHLAKGFAYVKTHNTFRATVCLISAMFYSPQSFFKESLKRIKLIIATF